MLRTLQNSLSQMGPAPIVSLAAEDVLLRREGDARKGRRGEHESGKIRKQGATALDEVAGA